MKKKIDPWSWGIGHSGRHCCILCAHQCKAGWLSGGLSSTGSAPTAPGQCGELVLPTLRWQWSVRAAGGGDLSSSSLGDGVGGLRCTSCDRENTNRSSGLRRSFLGGWLNMDGSTMVWWRLRHWLGFGLSLDGENRLGWLLI
jgi:hypothetical protein